MTRETEKYISLHHKTLEATKNFTEAATNHLATGLKRLIGGFILFIENQSVELALLRELEDGIRRKSLSLEEVKEILENLDALRKEITENAAKASAAAKEKAEAST